MPPKSETHACQTGPLDRLSSLPENVIEDILTVLPLRDAVTTCVLSKKWRYKWCRLPELKIDDELLCAVELPSLISQLLTSLTGPIMKFTLSTVFLSHCPMLDNMICFLSRNGIQHLVLNIKSGRYKFPPSFFTCSQLRHLSLRDCSIELPPPAFKGFDKLISLELVFVTISSKLVESLISHTPFLERLVLVSSVDSCHVIEIKTPMLRSFKFLGNGRSICLKNIPRLTELFINQPMDYNRLIAGSCNIVKYFEPFSTLERLHLGGMFFAGEVPTRLPFHLNSVNHLRLFIYFKSYLHDFSCALCLIRSCPYLQRLEIQMLGGNTDMLALHSLEVECFSDVNFNHLKEVMFRGFITAKCQIQFMKLLLSKSPVLVRMLIKIKSSYLINYAARKLEALSVKKLDELLKIQWVSPEVVVGYNFDGFIYTPLGIRQCSSDKMFWMPEWDKMNWLPKWDC